MSDLQAGGEACGTAFAFEDAVQVLAVPGMSALTTEVEELIENVSSISRTGLAEMDSIVQSIIRNIEKLPPRSASSMEGAIKALWQDCRIKIPFPNWRPNKHDALDLRFAKPSAIRQSLNPIPSKNSDGADVVELEMLLTMPSEFAQASNYHQGHFFLQRAYYLANIAAGLTDLPDRSLQQQYSFLNGNSLQPIIVLSPRHGRSSAKPKTLYQITMFIAISQGALSDKAIDPWKKSAEVSKCQKSKIGPELQAKLIYKNTLAFESALLSYRRLIEDAEAETELFGRTRVLVGVWLRQRGLQSSFAGGGFGRLEAEILLASLMRSSIKTPSKGPPPRLEGLGEAQLFTALIQFLASTDLCSVPIVINASGETPGRKEGPGPAYYDESFGFNLLFKMSQSSYENLRFEARATLECLAYNTPERMAAIFVVRQCDPHLKFDEKFRLLCREDPTEAQGMVGVQAKNMNLSDRILPVLRKALGERIELICISWQPLNSWNLDSAPMAPSGLTLDIGLVAHPSKAARRVDRGPAAGDDACCSFREFWGKKAELRRFNDGGIHESLDWTREARLGGLIRQICSFALSKHFPDRLEVSEGTDRIYVDDKDLRTTKTLAYEAFTELRARIFSLAGLPLRVQSVDLASTTTPKTMFTLIGGNEMTTHSHIVAILRIEGSSCWPDEILAARKTEVAFLLKLKDCLDAAYNDVETKTGIDWQSSCVLERPFIELSIKAVTIRLLLQNGKESLLLKHILVSPASSVEMRQIAAVSSTAYKRTFEIGPAHAQAMGVLESRFPALRSSIELFRRWCAAHLLSHHLRYELLDLLVAHVFAYPYPYTIPATAHTGFLRVLAMISRWDWRRDPLLVGLTARLSPTEKEAMRIRFRAWRKVDPLMNRVTLFVGTSIDPGGVAWTEGRIPKVVAARLAALARASSAKITKPSFSLRDSGLFVTPLAQYDFLLHMQARLRAHEPTFSPLNTSQQDLNRPTGWWQNSDPIQDFLDDIEASYGELAVFFRAEQGDVIAGLWAPPKDRQQWKVNLNFSSVPSEVPAFISNTSVALVDQTKVNRAAVLSEIARLGQDLIVRVDSRNGVEERL